LPVEGLADGSSDSFGDGRRKGISDLAVGSRFPSGKFPIVRETLDTRHHGQGKPWGFVHREIGSGWFFREAQPIDAQAGPLRSRPCWPKVCPSVLLAPADKGWSNLAGPAFPFRCPWPAPAGHEVSEGVTHGDPMRVGRGPIEERRILRPQGNENEARSQLGNAKVCCLQDAPSGRVSEIRELLQEPLPIFHEFRLGEALDILQKDSPWVHFPHESQGFGKQVALILFSQLFPGDGKRGTGHSSGEQVDFFLVPRGQIMNIALEHIPIGSVQS